MKYQQSKNNSCCFRIIASALFEANKFKAKNAIASWIQEYLVYEPKVYSYRIIIVNKNTENREPKKGEKCLSYTFEHWKMSRLFQIINDISEYYQLGILFILWVFPVIGYLIEIT